MQRQGITTPFISRNYFFIVKLGRGWPGAILGNIVPLITTYLVQEIALLRAPRFQGPRTPYALGGVSFLLFVEVEDLFFLLVDFFPQGTALCMLQGPH